MVKGLTHYFWIAKVSIYLADHITSNFLKGVFHKFHLVRSWIVCLIYCPYKNFSGFYHFHHFILKSHETLVKDILKAFENFKNKQESVWGNVFWHVKISIFWKSIQYTIHWGKTQILKKFPSDKITVQKIPSFFFREFQLIAVLLLICDS